MKNKIKNPLGKRILRELFEDWKKYFLIAVFLVFTISFVSGMYVANGSMLHSAKEGRTAYQREDGHFVLKSKLPSSVIKKIQTGKTANLKAFYLKKAKLELDKNFEFEFKKEFDREFKKEFAKEFELKTKNSLREGLLLQGINEKTADSLVETSFETTKRTEEYRIHYDKAYQDSYKENYDEEYEQAYTEAWAKIQDKVQEEYLEAEEKYGLSSNDFENVSTTVYENFYKNEKEDYNNDGIYDGNIRVYKKTDRINTACLMKGAFPENKDEIAIDRMHAKIVGIKLNDKITVNQKKYKVTGFLAYPNYLSLHEKPSDFVFDAQGFNVAMLTREGFDDLESKAFYSYGWQYSFTPENEIQEKIYSEHFLKSLFTHIIIEENEIKEFLPAYSNPAIVFAINDFGADKAMGGVLLNILIIIIAFIFGVTITNTILKEASVIGTLRASGYTVAELVGHYISIPVLMTFISAVIGNVLGYSFFKELVVSMYMDNYSLPVYKTIWNYEAFLKTTVIPVFLMFIVNLLVIISMLKHSPLQFLRQDFKKSKKKRTVRLPKWKFFKRFRIRIILQNLSNYIVLFLGVFFISVMLAMAVGMPDSLKFYQEHAKDIMLSKYQYVFKDYEDKDGNVISTDTPTAEKFNLKLLQKKGKKLNEDIFTYGIINNSHYVEIADLQHLEEKEIYISKSFAEKYELKIGSKIKLDEKYDSQSYEFDVVGIYDKGQNLSIFMPIDNYRKLFKIEDRGFDGYLSELPIKDIKEENIALLITEYDIIKMTAQMNRSLGAYMRYFQYLCILLSAILIYLLTKIIIEKNQKSISMTKILGYENREIASLYLFSSTIVLIIVDFISVFLGSMFMKKSWVGILSRFNGWFSFRIEPLSCVKMFAFIFIGYLLVLGMDFKRIKKIPLDEALKNLE